MLNPPEASSPISADKAGLLRPDPGALSGLLVLDFGQAAVGPVAASYLGMLGATVIKVEQPSGDSVRRGAPTMRGTSTTFIGNNLTKRGVVLDLKSPAGLADVKRLVAKADVLIENFRSPAVMERLGLGYSSVLAQINPRLVYIQSSAFGPQEGPWTGMYSDEWMTESVSGCVSATGARGGAGEFTRGSALLDWNGAMLNTVVCLAALSERARTGRGRMIQTSQFGSSIFCGLTRVAEFVATGQAPAPLGSASAWLVPDQSFQAADGFINVSAPGEKFWLRLCEAIERPALAHDARFASNAARVANRDALGAILVPVFMSRTVADWLRRLRTADVPCSANPDGSSLTGPWLRDEQVIANGMLQRIDSGFGSTLSQAPHWQFEKTPAAIRRPSPQFGEHTEAVLASIDAWKPFDSSTRAAGAVELAPPTEGSLAGLRVVELAYGIPGPLAGLVFAQLGASVVRIEGPAGDWMRELGAGGAYRLMNAGKTTLTVDLATDAGRQSVHEQFAAADIVLVGFREHKHTRLGIAYEQIRALNPRAVYCHLSGWGRRGPQCDAPATELLVQCTAGVPRYLGRLGAEPVRMGFDIASTSTALAAVQGVLAALIWRRASGEGQRVDVSMLAAAIAVNQWSTTAESGTESVSGRQLLGHRWPPDHGFACREGRCLIGFRDKRKWLAFAIAIGRVDLARDAGFRAEIDTHPALLAPRLEENLRTWSFASLDRLVRGELGGSVVPVLGVPAMLGHEQARGLGVFDVSGELTVRLPLVTTAGLVKAQARG